MERHVVINENQPLLTQCSTTISLLEIALQIKQIAGAHSITRKRNTFPYLLRGYATPAYLRFGADESYSFII